MGFSYDMVGIIKATNLQELTEFFEMYFSWSLLSIMVIMVIFIILFKRILSEVKIHRKIQTFALIVVFFGGIAINIKTSPICSRVFLGKINLFLSYKLPPDLKQFCSNFEMRDTRKVKTPIANIVFVIGESFSKSHSSLYGYSKNTNPKLLKLQLDSLLFVFNNVFSPATNTIACFKEIMSTYEESSNVPWYKHTTMIEILKKAGYKTNWISNQSQKGGYDNIVAKYAEICDTAFWCGNRFQGLSRTSYDEEVCYVLEKNMVEDKGKEFFLVHLMGSHYMFKARYPANFNIFEETDYVDYDSNQRFNLATYDNSILYNDYVVSKLMDLFRKEDAIIIYFPDHGLDIYSSSKNYIGHANSNPKSIESAKKIPFMIYTSEVFKETHKDLYEMISKNVNVTYNTSNFLYTIMDLIGKDFKDKSTKHLSILFNENTNNVCYLK